MTDQNELPHRQRAREWMRFDPLDTAYQIAKELDVGDDRAIFGLGGSALWYANEQKKMFLSELGDTYYRMPWNDALEIMRFYNQVRTDFEQNG